MREGNGMRRVFLMALAATWMYGAVDGVVTNGSTGKPQASVMVSLVQPGQSGMQTLASVKSDAAGKFKIDKDIPPGPAIVQAAFESATYNLVLTPGASTTGITVVVYDSTTKPESGKVAEHLILIEPSRSGVSVTETFLFDNQTQMTYADPAKGSAQFFLPKGAEGAAQVIVNSPGGMPISRPAEKTSQPGVYKIGYPLKPGETRFDVNYSLPSGETFAGKNVDPGSPLRLVTPSAVTLEGAGIDSQGQEPQTGAHIYGVRGAAFEAKITGLGSLRNAETTSDQPAEDLGQPQIEQAPARIYSRFGWVVGLTLTILALGGVMLYRKGTA
jgi:hypothetical protein